MIIYLFLRSWTRPLTIWTSTKLGRRISFSVASGQDGPQQKPEHLFTKVKQVERQTRYSTELCNLPARLTISCHERPVPLRRLRRVQVPSWLPNSFKHPGDGGAWRSKLSQGDFLRPSPQMSASKGLMGRKGLSSQTSWCANLTKINKALLNIYR